MHIYEVREISVPAAPPAELRGLALESPVPGDVGDAHVLQISGWAVGRDEAAESVEVVYNERVLRRAPLRGLRGDVAAALEVPGSTECAFSVLIGLIGLRLEPRLELRVVLRGGRRVAIGSITIVRQPLRTGYRPRLSPLVVTSLGRSGTTLLMKVLACHPQIVVLRRFPYESTPAKYWLHMLKVLAEPANLADSAHPETFFGDFWWIGSNPFHDELVYRHAPLEQSMGREYVERLAAFCQKSIDDWYGTLARFQAQPSPLYFAEKHLWPNYLPVLTWELYPRTKEVFLVRDFRDMALSAVAYQRRRGSGEPGMDGIGAADYVRGELRKMALDLRKSWRSRGERGHLVRYEDLVLRPAETVTALLEYLELDASPARVQDVLAHSSSEALTLPGASQEAAEVSVHHATSSEPEETIGRWRREGDDAFQALAQEAFADVLPEFGYER